MPVFSSLRTLCLIIASAAAAAAQDYRFSVLAGRVGTPGYVDSASAARFNFARAVTLDGRGNLLIADSDNHAIRRLSLHTGLVQTVAGQLGRPGYRDGLGSEALLTSPAGVAVDRDGNVLFSDPVHNTVRRITPAGSVETLPEFFNFPTNLAIDPQGNLLVSEGDRVRRRTPDGGVSTVAANLGGGSTGLSVDPAGNIYVSDQSLHIIRRIEATGVVTILAGEPTVYEPVLFGPPRIRTDTRGYVDATGRNARFNWPGGLAVDRDGSVLVADTANSAIRRVTPGGVVTTIAGFAPFSGARDGEARSALFFQPWGLVVDRDGAIYIADTVNYTVRKLADGRVTTIAGRAQAPGASDSDTGAVEFNRPFAIAADPGGGFLLVDAGNRSLRRLAADGVVSTLASGASVDLSNPEGLVVDAQGNVFISDRDNHVVRRRTATGQFAIIAGSLQQAGAADGAGGTARFNSPRGLALDRQGNLYVADALNHAIRKIAPDGTVTTLAGALGQRGAVDGPAAQARFSQPQGVAVDESGNVFVGDFANAAIRRITPAGVVTTYAGTLGRAGFADGSAPEARFTNPGALVFDARGDLYVLDATAAVRRVARDGTVRTLFGTALYTGSGPIFLGLAVDGLGRIVVTNPGEHTILIGEPEPAGALRLSNLSVRGESGLGNDVLIAGFNLAGAGTKPLLVRAVGPSLASFGLVNILPDPTLRLDSAAGVRLAENDDWRGEAALVDASAAAGAFPLAAASRDAVLLASLAPGSYTAQVGRGSGALITNSPRTALLEVYDTGGEATARLSNLSVRTRAWGGGAPLTVGFTLAGEGARRVLIRAIGPALTQFGVTDTGTDPALRLFRGGALLGQNDDWALTLAAPARTEMDAAVARTGAFPLASGSADAALLVTLPPGGYTVQVEPGAAPGVVLVEVYEVP